MKKIKRNKRKRNKRKRKKKTHKAPFERREISLDELKAIIDRASLSPEDHEQLTAAVETLSYITQELEESGITIARLRKLLFGSSSEKTRDVIADAKPDQSSEDGSGEEASGEAESDKEEPASSEDAAASDDGKDDNEEPKKRKGHGRNGADSYTGADKVSVPHDSLEHGDRCPLCERGKVYRQAKPAVLVRIKGVGPLSATVYELERLRCNACGGVFTAPAPPGVGDKKYDETSAAMVGLLKYGCGMPFNRLERLMGDLGIPLPAATQWDVVEGAAGALEAVWAELVRRAALGDVVYIDDTKARVLDLNAELRKALAAGKSKRTGVFTSGIVSTTDDGEIVLFLTGRKHAGENLEELLAKRSDYLDPPIQMCDALSRNTSGDFETILANCLAHGRRKFVELVSSFPDEVAHVLKEIGKVYKHDDETKEQQMSADERLLYHQEKSKPVMDELEKWFQKQFDDKLVEPNSPLGGAIEYMQNHWEALTLFERAPGAPLDNNIVEQSLKRAILHRKNSLFYKTENGARVGDMYMSLIFTAERRGENPFEYLVALQRNHESVDDSPQDWMPWNYRDTLHRLGLTI